MVHPIKDTQAGRFASRGCACNLVTAALRAADLGAGSVRTLGFIAARPGDHSGWHREIGLERPVSDRAAARPVRGRAGRGVLRYDSAAAAIAELAQDQHRQCRPWLVTAWTYRTWRSRPARRGCAAPSEIRGIADPGRSVQATHLHAVLRGDRARSRRRQRDLALRSEDREGLPAGQSVHLPRRRLLARLPVAKRKDLARRAS